jgi:plastocyanin
MLSLRLATALALLLSATACGGGDSSSPPTSPSPTPSPTAAPAPAPASSSVVIPVGAEFLGNGAFAPADLAVQTGTTVTWMNTDRDSHTTRSDGPGWNSGTISPGRGFSFAFQTPGTFPYHCAFHPGMVGRVVVAAAAAVPVTSTGQGGR